MTTMRKWRPFVRRTANGNIDLQVPGDEQLKCARLRSKAEPSTMGRRSGRIKNRPLPRLSNLGSPQGSILRWISRLPGFPIQFGRLGGVPRPYTYSSDAGAITFDPVALCRLLAAIEASVRVAGGCFGSGSEPVAPVRPAFARVSPIWVCRDVGRSFVGFAEGEPFLLAFKA
jgi:hypothetical protein